MRRFLPVRRQQGMLAGGFRQAGLVHPGVQRGTWFVHGQMAVAAYAEDTDVNGTVRSQPASDPFAFRERTWRVATEPDEPVRGDSQRIEEVPAQVRRAGGRIGRR